MQWSRFYYSVAGSRWSSHGCDDVGFCIVHPMQERLIGSRAELNADSQRPTTPRIIYPAEGSNNANLKLGMEPRVISDEDSAPGLQALPF